MSVVLGLIPNVLDFAKYGRIDVVELLKLIQYQIEGSVLPVLHTETEKLTKGDYAFGNKNAERPPCLFRKLAAKRGFVVATDKQIECWGGFATLHNQLGFADSASPRHHSHLRIDRKSYIPNSI